MDSDVGARLKQALQRVLWIGGPPDSGKTTIATLLGEQYDLQTYHFDRHELEHFSRVDPGRHPALYAAHPDRMTPEERWLGSSPEHMAADTIACWTERFHMAVDDLLAMPNSPSIIAEGPGFFPECVDPLITHSRKAIWLIPSTEFKLASAQSRDKPGSRHETTNSDLAAHNLIHRDFHITHHIRHQAHHLGLTVIEIDGSEDQAAMTGRIARHFRQYLPELQGDQHTQGDEDHQRG